ncbi:MAG: chitobiase/beta-hexosaminidase C-terminal domain-containing protein, partial [Candidatus Saccharimonadales bacterium]
DLIVAGLSLTNDIIPPLSEGIIVRTGVLSTQTLPIPSSPSTSEVVLYELDANLVGGRDYRFCISPISVDVGAGVTGFGGQIILSIYYTNDGSTPTTSSAIFGRTTASTSGSNKHQVISIGWETEYSPALDKTYRFLVSLQPGGVGSGTPDWQITAAGQIGFDYGGFYIFDGGSAVPDTGLWIGSGSSGGTTPSNFTKTYTAAHTYAYEGTNADSSPNPGFTPGAKINTDGKAYQGDDQLGDNGNTSTMITWPSSVTSDLSGATVTSITITLNNNHSWFNSGMTIAFGKHNGAAGGGTRPTYTDPNLVEGTIAEGATHTYSLNSQLASFTNALQGGQPFVLY